MRSLGAMTLTIGLLSYVLPKIGMQFQLVRLVEQIHPNAGVFFIVGGVILIILGAIVERSGRTGGSRVLVRVDTPAPRSGGGRGLLSFLVLLGILIGGGYYAETNYGASGKLKQWFAEFEKGFEKGYSGQSAPASARYAKIFEGGSTTETQTQLGSTRIPAPPAKTTTPSTGGPDDGLGGVQIPFPGAASPTPPDGQPRTVVIED